MSEMQANHGELASVTSHLIIPRRIAARLPETVCSELAKLPEAKQDEFLKAFSTRSRGLPLAYLSSLIFCHYGLLGRWAMTGMMWVSLFVDVLLGRIWWLMDLVRLPEMVREYNQTVAADILRRLNGADPERLAAPEPLLPR